MDKEFCKNLKNFLIHVCYLQYSSLINVIRNSVHCVHLIGFTMFGAFEQPTKGTTEDDEKKCRICFIEELSSHKHSFSC